MLKEMTIAEAVGIEGMTKKAFGEAIGIVETTMFSWQRKEREGRLTVKYDRVARHIQITETKWLADAHLPDKGAA